MINKNIQLLVLAMMALSMSAIAVPQTSPLQANRAAADAQKGQGTYKDEVEIMKFDEETGRDSFAIPFDEDALEDSDDEKRLNTAPRAK